MPGVTWIKLWVGIFDDEKVRIIQGMPDGDTIILCWIRLLCLAGKCGASGIVSIDDNIPYTDDMLASIWGKTTDEIRRVKDTLEQFGMIVILPDGKLKIKNWSVYQRMTPFEEMREYWRDKKREERAKKKNVLDLSETCQECQPQERERELEKEPRGVGQRPDLVLKKKTHFGEYVLMFDEEYAKLVARFGERKTREMIEVLDNYKGSKGKRYKSDYRAILSWVVEKCGAKEQPKPFQTKAPEKEAVEYHDKLGDEFKKLRGKIR
jgi:predicted phage replisome organizer